MSNIDPFDELALGTSPVRRRDLREKSTRRSRRTSRRRAAADRKLRSAVRASVAHPAGRTRPPRKPIGKRIAKALVSVVALALAAAFAVATAGSPLLFSTASATASVTHAKTSISTINGQHLTASGKETTISRDSVAALSAQELYSMKVGGLDYTVNNSGVIRWPFNSAVPVGSPFGPRIAPCRGCSTFHNGTDFETGDGAPIYAVAAGVVTISEFSGALGQHIAISHVIGGKPFTSIYGHMRAGSSLVQVGQVVAKGQPLGLTGSTGESTGPHLDFEIDIDGVPVDSFVWLKANTAH